MAAAARGGEGGGWCLAALGVSEWQCAVTCEREANCGVVWCAVLVTGEGDWEAAMGADGRRDGALW